MKTSNGSSLLGGRYGMIHINKGNGLKLPILPVAIEAIWFMRNFDERAKKWFKLILCSAAIKFT
ncbi:hypothetical protein [Loigolactobacillus backii]|uniref:hypothetical protein n=1 Tax=Loigolactobacillus backii TaxID=375175 RepID=UPI00117A9669|nr:hypothetical protein [Loigolactobacillus backii]